MQVLHLQHLLLLLQRRRLNKFYVIRQKGLMIMADEKNFNEEIEEVQDTAQEVTEAVEETVAEVNETAQEVVEEAQEEVTEVTEEAEEISEVDRAVAQAMAERDAQEAAAQAKKSRTAKKVVAIVAAVVVVLGAVASGFVTKGTDGGIKFSTYAGWLPKLCNPYNHKGFVDVTGNTVGDISEQMGMTVPEFLEKFGLPADMKASTMEMAALYMMPTKNYAENVCGIDYAQLKEILKIPAKTSDGEEITEETPWYIVEGEIAVKDYIGGEDKLGDFKAQYGLGDEVTGDTLWKEIRTTVDTKAKQSRLDSQKATEEETDAPQEATETTTEEATTQETEQEAPEAEKAE